MIYQVKAISGYVYGMCSVCKCVQVCVGVHGCVGMCAGVQGVHGVTRCGRVCTGERKWVQVGTSVRECALVYAGV